MAPHAWLWRGRHVKLTDGTTCLLPDTPRNQAEFPQHGQQELGAGLPLARIVGVTSLANGAVLDVAMGPYKGKGTAEHGLFRELRGCFVEGDVMLADSYYCSFYWFAARPCDRSVRPLDQYINIPTILCLPALKY
jgi:putative transposase